jgi:DNA processing protein
VSRTRRSPEESLRDAIAFALLPRVGCLAFRAGVEQHGDASEAFHASALKPAAREDALREADAVLAEAGAASATILVQGEAGYPGALMDLRLPPSLLFAIGDLSLLEQKGVGIVGTRHSSPAGERIAHQMAAVLVKAGAVVVSGMALGIDAAAHRGALDAGGGTIAVLGGGADLPYPPTHHTLHKRIAQHGLVLSEARLGTRPVLGAFPRRNRIIAALSGTLVVVEAGERSGALITSGQALELGRTIAAVPGPIDSPRHVGSNRLLAEGAAFISTVDELPALAGLSTRRKDTAPDASAPRDTVLESDPAVTAILAAVKAGVTDVDDLAKSTRLSARQVAGALSSLEIGGLLVVSQAGDLAVADRA